MGSLNLIAKGGVADPPLLDLTRQAEDDKDYHMMLDSVGLGDQFEDLYRIIQSGSARSCCLGCSSLTYQQAPWSAFEDRCVVLPRAAREHYHQVLHSHKFQAES